jgi:ABC-2 type transport system ATP-binding protein
VSDAAIRVETVGKRFKRYREKPGSIKARVLRPRTRAEEFWALRDVSFDVPQGNTYGLIGHNGSGKTTLLKIIGGILRPTQGRVVTRGRIAALLELGAGFHPELTGRENVYLNASLLGLSRKETQRAFEEIVAFSELEDFIDNQVKFYSSGMFVRLGFSVAIHVDPEILLIDEVLSVGDEGFQRRCLDRVRSFQVEGRTIVFVTHAVDLVRQICDHAIMLDHGEIVQQGDPDEVVRTFRRSVLRHDLAYAAETESRDVEVVSAALVREDGSPAGVLQTGDALVLQIDLEAKQPVDDPVVSFALHDQDNRFVFGTNSDWKGTRFRPFEGKKRLRFALRSLPFVSGKYWVTIGVHSRDSSRVYHVLEQGYTFEVRMGEENPGQVYIPVDLAVEDL